MTRDLQEVALAVTFQNENGLAAWQRKMRCRQAVESVGECADYRDLRNKDDKDRWLIICIRWIAVKNRQRRAQLEKDPDISDESHRP